MVYIILAIYNEERAIPSLVSDIRSVMKKGEYKIIAVDDGSSDDSLKILQELMDNDIIITPHKINLSIGAVFLTGFNKALEESKNDDDVIILMESDQTSDTELLKHLIDEIRCNGHDIAIASRFIKGGCYVNFPFLRKIYSVFANYLLSYFFPITGVKDYTIFYRSYRVGLLKKVRDFFGPYSFIQFRRFVSNSELLIKCSYFTKNFIEIPFSYDYSNKKGKSKLMPLQNIFEYIHFIFFMRHLEKKILQKIDKDA